LEKNTDDGHVVSDAENSENSDDESDSKQEFLPLSRKLQHYHPNELCEKVMLCLKNFTSTVSGWVMTRNIFTASQGSNRNCKTLK